MRTMPVRDYSKRGDALAVPNLIEVQTAAYARFTYHRRVAAILPLGRRHFHGCRRHGVPAEKVEI